MKWYKFRAYLAYFLMKLITRLLGVELPPLPSCAAIIEKGNTILAIKLTYQNGYGLPGGFCRAGENFEETVIREVKEETGLTVTSCKMFSTVGVSGRIGKIGVNYICEVRGKIRKSKEGTPDWIEPEEMINNCAYEDTKIVLRQYLDQNG